MGCHSPLCILMMFSFTLPQCKNTLSISLSSSSVSLQLASHFKVESATLAWLGCELPWPCVLGSRHRTRPSESGFSTWLDHTNKRQQPAKFPWVGFLLLTLHCCTTTSPNRKGCNFQVGSSLPNCFWHPEGAAHPSPNPHLSRVCAILWAFSLQMDASAVGMRVPTYSVANGNCLYTQQTTTKMS